MIINKPVLIIEHSTNGLKRINENVNTTTSKPREYRLSGEFTKFDIMNRNERIYTADKFLPHLNELVERKEQLGVLFGEWDHPDAFDTSLSRVSHTIEKIFYNKNENRVEGEIKLLSTHWGKEAKALVDDGCPLFVSSRAAGITESNGTVTVKKLFTYDMVADPGFASAKMSLNESLGFDNKLNTNFRIYDISDESKINELFTMNQNDYVTKNQMVEYSDYLKGEIAKLQEALTQSVSTGEINPEKIEKMSELYENMQEQQTKISQYLDYLAETIQVVVNENKDLKEKTEKLVEHNDYLAENLKKTITYSNYIAEQLDKSIDYGNYIAETLDKGLDFTEYIAEHVNKNIEFSDYLSESLEKNINYAEYIAENLDKNIVYAEYIAENLDKNIDYAEYIAESLDNNIIYSEYLAENLDNNIEYAEYLAEHVDNGIAYSEYIIENLSDTQAYTKYIAEGLDNTLEVLKNNKLFEHGEHAQQIPNMKVDNVERFYDDDEEEEFGQAQTQVQTQPVQGETIPTQGELETPAQGEEVVQPVQGELQTEPIQGQPIQGEVVAEQPTLDAQTVQEQPLQQLPTSVEGMPVEEIGLTPGMTVAIENQTGEVMAYNPQNKMAIVQLVGDASTVEVHESKIMVIGDKILQNDDSLKSYISGLITETKKRKASEQTEPHYLTFLTERNKNIWRNLTPEDREKVTYAINESAPVFSEADVLVIMQNSLTIEHRTFEDELLENIPSDLKTVWEQLNESHKKSVLSQAKLYPNLNTPAKIESFWNTRGLERYLSLNENKKVLNESRVVDGSRLSDEQIEKFIAKIKNLS